MDEIIQSAGCVETPIYREDVLNLLALTALADKRILSSEISVFANAAKTIEAELGLTTTFSEARLHVWFDDNRPQLKEKMLPENFEHEVNLILTRLKCVTNKNPIFDSMLRIANADDEFHISEQALIALAKYHWGIPYTDLSSQTVDQDAA